MARRRLYIISFWILCCVSYSTDKSDFYYHDGWETLPYPPSRGEFAVYDIPDLEDRINHVIEKYYSLEDHAIGYFTRDVSDNVSIVLRYFTFDRFAEHDGDGMKIHNEELAVDKGLEMLSDGSYAYNVTREFEYHGISDPFKKLLTLSLEFTLHSVRVFSNEEQALCLNIKGWLQFRDQENNGQVIENLKTLTTKIRCQTVDIHIPDWDLQTRSYGLAVIVIFLCLISFFVTVVIVVFACVLCKKTYGNEEKILQKIPKEFLSLVKITRVYIGKNFKRIYKSVNPDETNLKLKEYLLFFKLWDATSITADTLTLAGSITATSMKESVNVGQLDVTTVLLGVGCLFTWFSLLRYFKFHSKFHLLFTTIYQALGDVLVYLTCVGVLFIGFWVCGYVVLGPYNIKFSTPDSATETLLAVVNGDEIYATLAILDEKKTGDRVIWWFSRIYIWAYVALFTVIVLNLLVAIVLNSYEVIRSYYAEKEEQRDLGPLEKALQELVDNVKSSNIRQSVFDLLSESSNRSISTQEQTVQTELRKLFSIEKDDIVPIIPRTLKTFYLNRGMDREEEAEGARKCSIIMKFRLPGFCRGKDES